MHSKNSHSIHIGSWWCKQQILSDSRCERTVLSRMLYSPPTARAGAHMCKYAIKRQADGERLEHFKIQHSMKWPIWKRERLVWGKEKTNKENKKSLLKKKKDGHTYCPLVLCWKKSVTIVAMLKNCHIMTAFHIKFDQLHNDVTSDFCNLLKTEHELCCYLSYTGTYDSTSDRQKVPYISGPRNGVSGQLWTHWKT